MNEIHQIRALYGKFGPPELTNFTLADLREGAPCHLGAFVVADQDGRVVLIRRAPIREYPGIEKYWWIPGGAQKADEPLDETSRREFEEETGLKVTIERLLLAQLSQDRSFLALFLRGKVIGGAISPGADPGATTSEVRTFGRGEVAVEQLWTEQDMIVLVREGFALGRIDGLIRRNQLTECRNSS